MDDKEELLHTELMESLLDYLEEKRTLKSVLALGTTAHNRSQPLKNANVAEVVSELNSMSEQIANGDENKYSRVNVKEIFTTMLEKLNKD